MFYSIVAQSNDVCVAGTHDRPENAILKARKVARLFRCECRVHMHSQYSTATYLVATIRIGKNGRTEIVK